MKICYCDESGTGDEPIAVMVGIVVDSQRMHVTKGEWAALLQALSKIVNKPVIEIHTRDFYSGNGVWRGLSGPQRSKVIDLIFQWFCDRKHHLVYSSAVKKLYFENLKKNNIPSEVNSLWRFIGLHLVLSIQKYAQNHEKTKGNTIFVFDNENKEEMRFADLLKNPPAWSDIYYGKKASAESLNQMVDVPYFTDSQDVALIQVADFVAFFLRRYLEIKENLVPQKYPDEDVKVSAWIQKVFQRSIGHHFIYPQRGRCPCADIFYQHAPKSLRDFKF